MTRVLRGQVVGWVVVGLLTAACGSPSEPAEESARTVSVFGPYRLDEADAFAASLEVFTETTGIEVSYTGSGSFVSDLRRRVLESANPPDVAIVPQPGLVEEFIARGFVVPLSSDVLHAVEENYPSEAASMGAIDGVQVGVPYRASVKSLVWYRPDLFDAGGYEIPRTLAELDALVDDIETDGIEPWCLTIEAEGATGWVATDWVEDLLLRTAGIDVYDAWVEGTIDFADERIEAAFERFHGLALEPGRVTGGTRRVLQQAVRDAPAPLYADPPGCLLHRQASFARGWLPDDRLLGAEGGVDFFVLPGTERDESPPLLVGGDMAVPFSNSPETEQLLAYLATPESGRVWAQRGGYVSLRHTVDPTTYHDPADARIAQLLLDADTLGFDASDSMPAAIGSDLLWRAITDWVAGTLSYDDLATELDEARAAGSRSE